MKYIIKSEAIHKHELTVDADNIDEAQVRCMETMQQGHMPYEVITTVAVTEALTLDQN